MLPDNDPAKNIFYWKDLAAMRAIRRARPGARLLPFFIDAGPSRRTPAGCRIGGVTIIDLPNSHLQYAVTWYGLAAALAAVLAIGLMARRAGLDRGPRT